MNNEGIPTELNGLRYRSRLEATWAEFFDLCGWKYEYEPFDLDGYIPDFIMTNWEKPFLVEIKPFLDINDSGFEEAKNKIISSGWKGEFAIMGGGVLRNDSFGNDCHVCTGKTSEVYGNGDNDELVISIEPLFFFRCRFSNCNKISIAPCYGGWGSRVCGHYDGDHYLGNFGENEFRYLFNQAKNKVQYMARRQPGEVIIQHRPLTSEEMPS
jgi:hypothetical protein